MNSSNNKSDNASFSQKTLSREQIGGTGQHSNSGKEMDDFDKDALDGWQKASGGTELMGNLDKKFNPKSKFIYLAISILLMGIFGTILLTNPKEETTKHTASTVVDKSDVVLPADIKSFQELPEDLQIKPKLIVSNFKEKKEKQEVASVQPADNSPKEDEIQIVLPLKEVQISSGKPNVTIEKKTAKEIYLADFKLVDYRPYRSKNAITTKQMTLSGTPADQEKSDIQENDVAWESIDIPYHDYINQTMEQFRLGKFKRALNRTKFILEFYPDDLNALFYGGLCYYNLSEMNQAIDAFEKVVSNPFSNFDEEAFWYLANAYYLNNDKLKSKELFQAIVNQKGYYAKQAEKMLKK